MGDLDRNADKYPLNWLIPALITGIYLKSIVRRKCYPSERIHSTTSSFDFPNFF